MGSPPTRRSSEELAKLFRREFCVAKYLPEEAATYRLMIGNCDRCFTRTTEAYMTTALADLAIAQLRQRLNKRFAGERH